MIHGIAETTRLAFAPTTCLQPDHVEQQVPVDSPPWETAFHIQTERKQTVSTPLTPGTVLQMVGPRAVVRLLVHTVDIVRVAF